MHSPPGAPRRAKLCPLTHIYRHVSPPSRWPLASPPGPRAPRPPAALRLRPARRSPSTSTCVMREPTVRVVLLVWACAWGRRGRAGGWASPRLSARAVSPWGWWCWRWAGTRRGWAWVAQQHNHGVNEGNGLPLTAIEGRQDTAGIEKKHNRHTETAAMTTIAAIRLRAGLNGFRKCQDFFDLRARN